MNGLMFFDNSEARTLEQKIDRAAEHYQERHGTRPTRVYVHLSMNDGNTITQSGIEVITTRVIHPNTFWLTHEVPAVAAVQS